MQINNSYRRVDAVFIFFLLLFLGAALKLLFMQIFHGRYLSVLAKRQQSVVVELEPLRGAIYTANLTPLAINISVDSVYACPRQLSWQEKDIIAEKLSSILEVPVQTLRERLAADKAFVWLARKISDQQSQQIKSLRLKGVYFLKESKRCYPNLHLASHIIGFTDLDNHGLEGLERYYDSYLRGKSGWMYFLRDAHQRKLPLFDKMLPQQDGYNIVLTIDEVVQYIVEQQADSVYRTHHAKAATIIVMDPNTGAILAMANRPTFDPNEYNLAQKEAMRNRAITDLFEPGSVFKIVTAAAALEEQMVDEGDVFYCENGAYAVAGRVLHDHQPHSRLTFREVIEKSSNIGTVKVAQLLGAPVIYKYSRLFGFGSRLGIDLPGEITGILRPPERWSKTSLTCVPIGQEVGVTALQLVSAISVIANGGKLVRPYLVKEIRDRGGQLIRKVSPTFLHTVISSQTAQRLKAILAGVVESGTGKLAKIEGITCAGKTGTAQKVEPDGTYSHSRYVASFIGFAPVENPQIAVAVVVDEPHPLYFGGVVAAPVFKNVVRDALRYMRLRKIEDQIVQEDETPSVVALNR